MLISSTCTVLVGDPLEPSLEVPCAAAGAADEPLEVEFGVLEVELAPGALPPLAVEPELSAELGAASEPAAATGCVVEAVAGAACPDC